MSRRRNSSPLPVDLPPEVANVFAGHTGWSRRRFLGASLGTAAAAAMPAALAGCGSGSGTDLYIANWTEYIDEPDPSIKEPGTVARFEKATGLSIKYSPEFNDNNEYFAKIQPDLSHGHRIGADIIVPTFWLAGRLIRLGWVDKLPLASIPNAKRLDPTLQKPPWDPTGEYSLPWQSGFAGIAYNSKVTGRALHTIDDLWDPKFKGKIGLLLEMRDSVGLVALSQGVDIEHPTAKALMPAIDVLRKQVQAGQIRRFTGNDYISDLQAGNFAACIGWSGDLAQLQKDSPELHFVIPDSGGTLWSDTMVIPKGAKHVSAAAKWMDFVYDPVNAARIAAYVQYVSPVVGVQEELRKMGGDSAELANNPLLFPDAAAKKKLKSWGVLSDEDEETLDREFARLQGN